MDDREGLISAINSGHEACWAGADHDESPRPLPEHEADAILASDWLAEHDREVAAAERERIYREVRGIPAWGTLEEREDHGGFDVPGQNARALVLAAIRTEPPTQTRFANVTWPGRAIAPCRSSLVARCRTPTTTGGTPHEHLRM